MKLVKCLILLPLLIILWGCNGGGENKFEALENIPDEVTDNDPSIDGPVSISSITPTANPIILISGLNTFAVQIDAGAGDNVTYDFRLDGVSVQNTAAPFYVLTGTGVTAGAHTLEVVAANPSYSDSHTFNLYKNTAPTLSLVSNTATTISCFGGTFTMNVSAIDVDADALTFSFYHNGALGSSALANTTPTASTASTVFTPTCPMAGINNVKIRVTDTSGEYDEETVAVTVSNPSIASITSYSPLSDPVIIASSQTQTFQISPDGTSPFGMTWTLTPTVGVIAACDDDSSCDINNNSGARVGTYTLNVELTDQGPTPAEMDFNIYFNAPPIFGATTPSNSSAIRFNCNEAKEFTVNFSDQNGIGSPQTHSATWTYKGVNVTNASISNMFTVTTNVTTHPFSSTLRFAPNCDEDGLGSGDIKVVISDNIEDDDLTWNVYSSFLSTKCLNLAAGQICTVAGLPGLSDDFETGSTLVKNQTYQSISYTAGSTNPKYEKLKIRPNRIEEYVNGSDTGFFIADNYHHVVWFYNHNSAGGNDITVNNITIGPKEIRVIAGVGAPGFGISGMAATSFYLNNPMGVAYSGGNLYIADYSNSRIVKVASNGVATDYTYTQCTGGPPCTTYAVGTGVTSGVHLANSGVQSTSLKCLNPSDIEISNGLLYVSCYGNANVGEGSIIAFDLTTGVGTEMVQYAATNAAGAVTVAASNRAWSLAKHPSEETIFFTVPTNSNCAVGVINNTASTNNTYTVASTPTTMPVNAGQVAFPINTLSNCAAPAIPNNLNAAAIRLAASGDLEVKMNGANVVGLFMSQNDQNYVTFINLSGLNATFGTRTVSPGQMDRVLGTGTRGLNHAASGYASTLLSNPKGLAMSGSTLLVADSLNWRIASFDTSVSNGSVSTFLGNKAAYGYDGEVDAPANNLRLGGPMGLAYDSSRNRIYFSEGLNSRIRYIELDSGRIRTSVGSNTNTLTLITGGGNTSANSTANRLLTNLRLAWDLSVAKDVSSIFFTDTRNDIASSQPANWNAAFDFGTGVTGNHYLVNHTAGTAANQMCHLRAVNDSNTSINGVTQSGGNETVLGVGLPVGEVGVYGGIFTGGAVTSGCDAWAQTDAVWTGGTLNGTSAVGQALGDNPFGIIANDAGTETFVALRQNHCIVKIQSNMTQEIGKCNSGSGANSGSTNNLSFANTRLTNPGDLEWDPANPGNYFIMDRSLTTGSLLKYANYSSTDDIDPDGGGSEVLAETVGQLTNGLIPSTINFGYGFAVNTRMICFSQGAFATVHTAATVYAHNVICLDRSGGGDDKIFGRQNLTNTATVNRSKIQFDHNEEGASAGQSTSFYHPMGLAFDADGNLYIADYGSNTIKMIKKWWD